MINFDAKELAAYFAGYTACECENDLATGQFSKEKLGVILHYFYQHLNDSAKEPGGSIVNEEFLKLSKGYLEFCIEMNRNKKLQAESK